MYLRKSGCVFFNKCIHNRKSKKARRKREHGRHFHSPKSQACEILCQRPGICLYHYITQELGTLKMPRTYIPHSFLWKMPGFHSPSSQHMIQLQRKSKTPNVCIYKLVNVFEGCLGDGLNQITNQKSLTVFLFYGK